MVRKICPICDQVMTSAHYCRNCRSWVKHPYVRDVTYYLNERHPQGETGCSYHAASAEGQPAAGWTLSGPAHQTAPRPNVSRIPAPRPNEQTPRPNVSRTPAPRPNVQPPQPNVSRTAAPQPNAQAPRPNMSQPAPRPNVSRPPAGPAPSSLGGSWVPRPQNEQLASGAGRGRNGLLTVLIIAGVLVCVVLPTMMMISFSEYTEPFSQSREYDVDLGDYTGEEPNYTEYEDAEVIAAGVPCSGAGHFSIDGEKTAEQARLILADHGYEISVEKTYSYNEKYDDGSSWYDRWVTIYLKQEAEDTDVYDYVEIDSDTATGQLHQITVSVSDREREAKMTRAFLDYLAQEGELPDGAAFSEEASAGLTEAMAANEDCDFHSGPVGVEGYDYGDYYEVSIYREREAAAD